MKHLSASPQSVLRQVFGYDQFRSQQQTIIDNVLAGYDNFVLMPTGGGKSLCYQIPALLRPGVAIVVSPLISLMQDQVSALQANGVAAAYYNSSLDSGAARQVLTQLHRGELDLLYIAPERILSAGFLERLQDVPIALFAIDEAHCISQWGHDFRPEYAQLGQLRQLFPQAPILALTATADKQTRADILQRLNLAHAHCHVASFDRPNIRYRVINKHKPLEQVIIFLQTQQQQSGIIYCNSRKRVDEIAERLCAAGFAAAAYHAGMLSSERYSAQRAFQQDDIQIMVATIAFGMGIDKPNVRFVLHYDLPKSIENYYQETGRAGRDGLTAEALLLFGAGDIAQARGLIERTENLEQRRVELHKLNAMTGFAEAQTCRRKVLLHYFGEHLPEPCGNCDVCLNPPRCYDATDDARKALSCVYRVNQSFGVGHVIDVLRGADKQRIRDLHHQQLSTYGIGKQLSQDEWLSIFRQLIHHGFLEQDITQYSILKLTPQARPLLRGEMQLTLALPALPVPRKTSIRKISATDTDYDTGLFEQLRKLRKSLADNAGVPPFVVFSDASLVDMAAKKPRTSADFLMINGVGEHKLARYGGVFMQAIEGYIENK